MPIDAQMMTSSRFIDLSQTFEDGMPGIRRRQPDGSLREETVRLRISRTREESAAGFESTEISFPTAIATYIDSPYCRYAGKRDIGALDLDDVILPGVVVDCRGRGDRAIVGAEVLPTASLAGYAVLFLFGWQQHWATERYGAHPAVGPGVVDRLIADGARLLGTDTGSADAPGDPEAPVHSRLLERDVLISENLLNLDRLVGTRFRFFAVPLKARGATSMPVRAFAELI